MSVGTVVELLELEPRDLAELLAEAAPGELPEVQAAALGLDLAVHEHRTAIRHAIESTGMHVYPDPDGGLVVIPRGPECSPESGQVQPDPGVSAGEVGVRSDLTPESRAEQDAHTGNGGPLIGLTGALDASRIGEVLAEFRGRPEPVAAGTFAIYSTAEGGLMIVLQDPAGEVSHLPLHPKFVKLSLGIIAGKGGPFRRLLGG